VASDRQPASYDPQPSLHPPMPHANLSRQHQAAPK